MNLFLAELLPVGTPCDKPEQFLSHATPEYTLGGQQWKPVTQVEPVYIDDKKYGPEILSC